MDNKDLDFENLEVYQRSINFCDKIFGIVNKFSIQLQFSLGDQLRRASLSICNNIAEGSNQNTTKEKKLFYHYALNSARECFPCLTIANKQKFISDDVYLKLREECLIICRMLKKLIVSLEKNQIKKTKALAVVAMFFQLLTFNFELIEGAFLDYGGGARPEGMAGAFTAISDDSNAIYYNPAGLAQLSPKEANLMYAKPWLGLSGVDISFMHGIFTYPAEEYGSFGIEITQYDVNALYSENTITVGYGYNFSGLLKLEQKLLAGINLKYLGWSVNWDEESKKLNDPVVNAGNSKSDFGIDFGVLAEPWEKLRVGFLGRNLNSPDIGLYYENKLPQEFHLGFGYNFGDLGRLEDFTPAVDFSYRAQEYGDDSKLNYSAGVEAWLNFHTFGFRVGFNKTDFTIGASYYPRFSEGSVRLKIDYALLISTVYPESLGSHRISFGIEF